MYAFERNRPTRRLAFLTLGMSAALAACVDYEVVTTVRPDGSGVREVRIEATDPPDSGERRQAFVTLAHLTTAEGWTPGHELDSDGDTVFTFHRRTEIPDLEAWSRVSGGLTIDGTLPTRANERVGYVRLGDVRFRNEVRVGRGRTSDGTTTLTYRETFRWDQAVEALVELVVQGLELEVADRFPRLTAGERGQIAGAFRTRLWIVADAGLFDDDIDQDALLDEAFRATADQVVRIVRPRYPETTTDQLRELVRTAVEGDAVGDAFSRMLPGMDVGFNTSFDFRLDLPGTVVSSNADRQEGRTLVWEFGADDALQAPVEIRAESVVER